MSAITNDHFRNWYLAHFLKNEKTFSLASNGMPAAESNSVKRSDHRLGEICRETRSKTINVDYVHNNQEKWASVESRPNSKACRNLGAAAHAGLRTPGVPMFGDAAIGPKWAAWYGVVSERSTGIDLTLILAD